MCDMLEAYGHFYIIHSLQCRVYMSSTEVVFNIERINKVRKAKHRHVMESKTTLQVYVNINYGSKVLVQAIATLSTSVCFEIVFK